MVEMVELLNRLKCLYIDNETCGKNGVESKCFNINFGVIHGCAILLTFFMDGVMKN